jgi:hypothetical protein
MAVIHCLQPSLAIFCLSLCWRYQLFRWVNRDGIVTILVVVRIRGSRGRLCVSNIQIHIFMFLAYDERFLD